ncbi:ATP-binding cassette domain-containing protein [Paractinoplanes maris]|uniref:ATP-binding cassette domain-containing protein n=1 Tax=Paractinoplanes maris TaxID=1734446 RepID=UPI002021DB07|nr:ATP-binding cassette domain-containing protein [Actinoplanes maris]
MRYLGHAYRRAFVAPSELRVADAGEAGLDYSAGTEALVDLTVRRGLVFAVLWTLRRAMLGYLLFGAVLVTVAAAVPPAITRAVAALSAGRSAWGPLTVLSVLAAGFALARWALTWRARDLQLRASLLVQRVLFHRLQRVDPGWLVEQGRSTSSYLITWPDQISQLVFLAEFVVYAVLIMVLAGQLIATFGLLGAVVMALVAAATFALRPLGRATVRLAVAYLDLDHGRSRLVDDLARQRRQVRRARLLVPLTLTLQRVRAPQLRLLRRRAWLSGSYDAILDSLPVLFAAVLLAVAQLSGGTVASAKLAAVLVASRMIVSAVGENLITARVVQSGSELARSVDELVRQAPPIVPAGTLAAGALRVAGIDVAPGTRVAVTGPGAGSLLRTIADQADVRGGSVHWLGRDHRAFDGTVADVVTLWSGEVSDQRYADALERSGLAAELAARDSGDATLLSSSARVLSDGQSVRLGLAQALCHDSDVLVLDDVFAPLDPASASRIAERVLRPASPQTIVYSTSRPELVSCADLILQAEAGTVTASRPAGVPASRTAGAPASRPAAGPAGPKADDVRRLPLDRPATVVAPAFDNQDDARVTSVAALMRMIFGVPLIVLMTLAAAAGILGELFLVGYTPTASAAWTYAGVAGVVLAAYLVRHITSYRASITAVDGLHSLVTDQVVRPGDRSDPAAVAGRLGRDFATAESQAPRVLSMVAIGVTSLLISVAVVAAGNLITVIPSALLCGGLALAYVRSRAATQAALRLSAAARAPLMNFAVAAVGYPGFHLNPSIRAALFARFDDLAALRAASAHRLQWVRLRLLLLVELIGAGFFLACAWAAPLTRDVIAPAALVYIAYSLSQQVVTVVERAQSGEVASRQVDRVLALLPAGRPSHRDLIHPSPPAPEATGVPGPVELRDVVVDTVEDNRTPAPLSAVLPVGSLTWVAGPSGIGKSSLLETIAGFTPPRSGTVVAPPAVFVDSDLPDLSIPVSAMGPGLDWIFTLTGRPAPGPQTPVNRLPPADRQLVAIARAVRSGAPLILLDEATSSLSVADERAVLGVVRRPGRTVIAVSHRPDNQDLAEQVLSLTPARLSDATG